jgi:hypothetical protein
MFVVCGLWILTTAPDARGAVMVFPTLDPELLKTALNATNLTITSATIRNGEPGQFGTYTNFTNPPITIGNGVVLSSGDVSYVGAPPSPELEYPQPDWKMGALGTAEFDGYGPGRIENFLGSWDVAALEVNFHLNAPSQIQFDFIFGSVEYPYWTSEYTDAMLVFLDGMDVTNQIVFDDNQRPIQVGISFAGLVETGDQNTAFASPHGMSELLTTTSTMLAAGTHRIVFEVGDLNDYQMDSAMFIANFRAGTGVEGTEPTLKVPPLRIAGSKAMSAFNVSTLAWTNGGAACVLENSGQLATGWSPVSAPMTTNGNVISIIVTNAASVQFYRLRKK